MILSHILDTTHRRVINTPAVYPRLVEFLQFDLEAIVSNDFTEGYT